MVETDYILTSEITCKGCGWSTWIGDNVGHDPTADALCFALESNHTHLRLQWLAHSATRAGIGCVECECQDSVAYDGPLRESDRTFDKVAGRLEELLMSRSKRI